MPKTPILKAREVISILESLGFHEVRQRGSHKQFRHSDGRGTTVPFHDGAMFIVGCLMESLSVMIMSVPVLLPLLQHAKIDLAHFGIFFILNCMIGAITSPVGTMMYVVCAPGKVSIIEFAKEVWPFVIALVIALLIVTYVPALSLWLPNLIIPG